METTKSKKSAKAETAAATQAAAPSTETQPLQTPAPVNAAVAPIAPIVNPVIVEKPATETSFSVFQSLYTADVKGFVQAGAAIMRKCEKAKADTVESIVQLKTLGLQFAVLGREYFTRLMNTPAWFNKSVGDFISHTYALKEGQKFPSAAWLNAQVVLFVVVPNDGGTPLLAESNYLELTQRALGILAKIVMHKKVVVNGHCNRSSKELQDAMALATSHGDGYVKKLQAILDGLNGNTSDAKEAEKLSDAFATISKAILAAGDGDEEKAKLLFCACQDLEDAWEKSGIESGTQDVWGQGREVKETPDTRHLNMPKTDTEKTPETVTV